MAIDPPYRLDPFQNIIDVKWKPTNPCQFDNNYSGFGPSAVVFKQMIGGQEYWGTFVYEDGIIVDGPYVHSKAEATAAMISFGTIAIEIIELPTWWYVGDYQNNEDSVALMTKPAWQGPSCQVPPPP